MIHLGAGAAQGHEITLARTDPRHFYGRLDPPVREGESGDFRDLLINSLDNVSNLERNAEDLAVQATVNPDSVNAHDVTIAAAQASLALSLTKSVVDRVIQAYREIQNVR
jgi:flagellar hook-basal body complex protein FliE